MPTENPHEYVMYTDGGCYNAGKRKGDGSYAFLFKTDNREFVDVCCEFIPDTTNNRTEMMAVIEGLKHANTHNISDIEIISDSSYLVNGYTDPAYLEKWVNNGWKTSTNKPVQNVDLWTELQKMSWHMGFNFKHIRGHNKDRNKTHAFWNSICDKACTYMLTNFTNPGFIVTLRYYFKSKTFEQINVRLVERQDDNYGCDN